MIGEEELQQKIKLALKNNAIPVYYCGELDEVQDLKDKAEQMKRGVVILEKLLGYGTDIRFDGHPECVVYADKMPIPYEYLQFCGRSQRANVRSDCMLFVTADEITASTYMRKLEDYEDAPFNDGDKVLGIVFKHLKDCKTDQKRKKQPTVKSMTWQLALGDWFTEIGKQKHYR